jgi:hypothetical protein
VVHDVEKLRPEMDVERFRNPPDWRVLVQGKIVEEGNIF